MKNILHKNTHLHNTLYSGSRQVAVFEKSTWSPPLKLLQLPSRLLMARHLNEPAWSFSVGSRTEIHKTYKLQLYRNISLGHRETASVQWCKWQQKTLKILHVGNKKVSTSIIMWIHYATTLSLCLWVLKLAQNCNAALLSSHMQHGITRQIAPVLQMNMLLLF